MAITTKTAVSGKYTVEISYGTEQEVTDRIAALLTGNLWNISISIEGFAIDSQGVVTVLLRYLTLGEP